MEGRNLRCFALAGLLLLGSWATAFAGDSATSKVSVSIPAILQISYDGSPVLSFDVSAGDVARGYSELHNSGIFRWATNANRWVISAAHTPWTSAGSTIPDGMSLMVRAAHLSDSSYTASGTLLQDWAEVGEEPSALLSGSDGSQGELSGLSWRAANFPVGIKAGIYQTTVTFCLTPE